ncbi:MAG: CBS domain-containing protein [Methanotrichaceae archaeon]|nr:CBS domain-containing protein [Methanotrichaceae archaeon]
MDVSLQLGKIMGIPVRLHWSFLVVVLYVAWAFSSVSEPILGRAYGFGAVEPVTIRWAYSFLFAILLFVCVAVHELGHSYIAKSYGIGIKSITLYFFGGVASMEEIPRDPRKELKMALVGPLVSGALGFFSILLYLAVSSNPLHPIPILLWTLGVINIILMIFNLIPAFPMDGGRVLRAWFATRMPYVSATRRAANVGKMFAVFLGILGLFSFNFIMLFIAFFIYIGASEEEKATTIDISLEGIKVKNIMSVNVKTITPDLTLRQLMELMFQEKHRGYPVLENGSLKGIVTITDLQRVPDSQKDTTNVGQVMTRNLFVIGPDEEASIAMKIMSEKGIHRLPVLQNEELVGIVSREDLVRAIELCSSRSSF